MQTQTKFANFSFTVDVTWCLEQLLKDGRITERDKLLIQTTHRQKEQLKWHPLQWIAHFNLKDQLQAGSSLTLIRLCQWLGEKAGIPFWQDISAHWLRVAFATTKANNGIPLHIIQYSLGHSNIKTTMSYIKNDQEAINKAMMTMAF